MKENGFGNARTGLLDGNLAEGIHGLLDARELNALLVSCDPDADRIVDHPLHGNQNAHGARQREGQNTQVRHDRTWNINITAYTRCGASLFHARSQGHRSRARRDLWTTYIV